MSEFEVYSAIFYFDDFIKVIFINNENKGYFNQSSYEHKFFIKDYKYDEELLFYSFI